MECKKRLIDVLVALIEPIRQKRLAFEKNLDYIAKVLREGTEKANSIAGETCRLAKEAMKQVYF